MTSPPRSDCVQPYGHFRLNPWQTRLLSLTQRQTPTWLGRKVALILRKIVLRGRNEPIDAQIGELRMRVHVRDNVSERKFLFMPNFCDPAERRYVVEHLSNGGTFLDIGANAGIYTLTAAHRYGQFDRGGRVLAVEANPTMQARLSFNIQLNAFEAYAKAIPLALSDHVGSAEFTVSETNLGESGLATPGARKITVPCTTLLDLLEQEGVTKLDGIKIDVEGMEDVILLPFFEQADKSLFPGFIIIENSSNRWRSDLLGLMRKCGYAELGHHKMNHIMVLQAAS